MAVVFVVDEPLPSGCHHPSRDVIIFNPLNTPGVRCYWLRFCLSGAQPSQRHNKHRSPFNTVKHPSPLLYFILQSNVQWYREHTHTQKHTQRNTRSRTNSRSEKVKTFSSKPRHSLHMATLAERNYTRRLRRSFSAHLRLEMNCKFKRERFKY